MILFISGMFWRRFNRSFSNSFPREGKMLIGRYEDVVFLGLPDLGTNMIVESFQIDEKLKSLNIALNI
jgi:hypothetical protein